MTSFQPSLFNLLLCWVNDKHGKTQFCRSAVDDCKPAPFEGYSALLFTRFHRYTVVGNAGFQLDIMLWLNWLRPPNALRTLCRSQKPAVPWSEKPKLHLTPCGHVRWTWQFHLGNTIDWWHQQIAARFAAPALLEIEFGRHEFDWASCWSVWWLGASLEVIFERQQIENAPRRPFSESQ